MCKARLNWTAIHLVIISLFLIHELARGSIVICTWSTDDTNETLLLHVSIDKSKALSLLVHCADISHPAKNWNLHSRWTDLLVEEFFKQVQFICFSTAVAIPFCRQPCVEFEISGISSGRFRDQSLVPVALNCLKIAESIQHFEDTIAAFYNKIS